MAGLFLTADLELAKSALGGAGGLRGDGLAGTLGGDLQRRHDRRRADPDPARQLLRPLLPALDYGLAIDPQGMVTPQSVDVRVRFPKGFTVSNLPAGWKAAGARAATYRNDALETSEMFEITASP